MHNASGTGFIAYTSSIHFKNQFIREQLDIVKLAGFLIKILIRHGSRSWTNLQHAFTMQRLLLLNILLVGEK